MRSWWDILAVRCKRTKPQATEAWGRSGFGSAINTSAGEGEGLGESLRIVEEIK